MSTEPKKRVLRVTGEDDDRRLLYECYGKPATLQIGEIKGVTPSITGVSQLERGVSEKGRMQSALCDSTSAEVLHVLGWD